MGTDDKTTSMTPRQIEDHVLHRRLQIKNSKPGELKSGEKVLFVDILFMGGSIRTMADRSLSSKLSSGAIGDAVLRLELKMVDVFDFGRKENKAVFLPSRLVDFVPCKD